MKVNASSVAAASSVLAALVAATAAIFSYFQVRQASELLAVARAERRPVLVVYVETQSLSDGTTAALDSLTNVGTAPATLIFREGGAKPPELPSPSWLKLRA